MSVGLKYKETNEEFDIDTSEKKRYHLLKKVMNHDSQIGDVHFIIHPKFNNELT